MLVEEAIAGGENLKSARSFAEGHCKVVKERGCCQDESTYVICWV